MRISVKVSPRSQETGINRIGDRDFKVKVKAPPEKGKANKEVIEVVARYFKVPKSQVRIVRGHKNRKKTIEIISL
ncbi:MAG: YggU family protein [Candidatus Aminicenantes bacterium]|nr:YggU family protein [Candidatus Aminicenantes bacterium]